MPKKELDSEFSRTDWYTGQHGSGRSGMSGFEWLFWVGLATLYSAIWLIGAYTVILWIVELFK